MSDEEKRLASMWHREDGKAPSEIATPLHRDKSTITRHLSHPQVNKQGRARLLTKLDVDRLVAKTKAFIKQAGGRYRVTAKLIQRRLRLKASTWTILRALRLRGLYFRKNRESLP